MSLNVSSVPVDCASRTILAIETSCDETAVALLRGFGEVLFSDIASQASIHARYGGVVPEIASRSHLDVLPLLIERAFYESTVSLKEVDLYAATAAPGLPSALIVGTSLTRGLALGAGRPFVPINHIEGHLLSPFFGEERIEPHIALVVSGGHTLLFDIQGFERYKLLGGTRDDAAGEAFDKVAKFLGLSYPGGARIDALAKRGDASSYAFPRSMLHSGDWDFSFSGLKTAVRSFLEKKSSRISLPDLCASFQEAVVDILVTKTLHAACVYRHSLITVSGGVSSNSRLQTKMKDACADAGISLRVAGPELQTDNALMIAFTAAHKRQ
ncbi:tRNA N6-adenosine threonylcarbamoyltransferase [Candidatus Xiphinematobacter sp. Idaho Grape]|uniref:tRNA (adenosine(37)-N6)-threonylcarbamoyltransferase complex transferase subunit TsaD n=1 Tax=Candidatus Xiphinematobacter sp. Idaho Grape TaxID=1704307 RepID=UPI0007064989|nr:tRNA (adenosine(37)-N6)-threonylcarbamoyltransferase complex transferase subunit TsaD [Candidatus Xiphinematobacter sp. Idaho Grape]ALJ56643.1 tRNA N6-adenosine threonylcarbamoyltransferase [Candidatus Xiphinematobacter sp. Idaho Grape]